MSFVCRLTSSNKCSFKDMISGLYNYSRDSESKSIAMLVCIWILEYFRAWWFIDSEEDVVDKKIKAKLHASDNASIVALFVAYVDLRNELVHSPYNFKAESEVASTIKMFNIHQNIQQFCSVFEEDAKEFELIYKDVMKTLGLYKDENSTSRDDKRHPFDEPLEQIDSGF